MYERQGQPDGVGLGWILLLLLLYVIFNPIPGPIDDCAATAVAGYYALKG